MTFYLSHKAFPELRNLEPAKRQAAWHACWFRPFRAWQTWAVFLSQILFIFSGAAIGLWLDGYHRVWFGGTPEELMGLGAPVFGAVLGWLGCVAGALFFTQVHGRRVRPYLKRYLQLHHDA